MYKLYKEQTKEFSTKSLEKQIVNRKKNKNGENVEWLKIQWLNFKKEQPFQINYKYSNIPEVQFNFASIYKRKSKLEEYIKDLDILYPTSYKITVLKKKKKLMDLLHYIPPINHLFYNILQTDGNNTIDDLPINFDEI